MTEETQENEYSGHTHYRTGEGWSPDVTLDWHKVGPLTTITRVRISWSCIGAVGIARAKAFRDALSLAIIDAEAKEQELGIKEPRP